MKNESKQFIDLVEDSSSILILTHRGPDPDAFCSSLLMKKFLNNYYSDKKVRFISKQMPTDNIPFMKEIGVVESIELGDEDLIIVCDIPNIANCFEVGEKFEIGDRKVVYVDHHEVEDVKGDLIINHRMASATEQVLMLWMDIYENSLDITPELSELGQRGIVSDTGRFMYNSVSGDTYRVMGVLRDIYSLDLEELSYKSAKFPSESILPITMFLKNMQIKGDMSYFYLTDEDLNNLEGVSETFIKEAAQKIKLNYIRFLFGVHWGFVIRPSFTSPDDWQVSFRSTNGYQDVDGIAKALGGGGHKRASAATFKANSSEEALNIVLETIKETLKKES